MALTARPGPGLVSSVSLAPSALRSHVVHGGGSWLGEERLIVFLRWLLLVRRESCSGDGGRGTLPKAIDEGGQVMGTDAPRTQQGLVQPLSVLEVLT